MKTRFTERPAQSRRPASEGPSLKSGEGVKVEESITINRPADELYRFWREFNNLSRFMRHVKSVSDSGDGISHWVIEGKSGEFEWDARIIEDKPGEMISWQSLQGADVDNAGSVWFVPTADGRGTVVKLSLKYAPPGGKIGALAAKFFGDSAQKLISEDLARFKTLMETGEIPSATGKIESY